MTDQPINSKTSQALQSYLESPGQAIGLVGPEWLNKDLLASRVASQLLETTPEALSNYPYFLNIGGKDTTAISIDDIRSINDFLILKVPSNKAINRVVVINQAHKMRPEAQNALLKNLEEPPRSTVFILTAESASSLLPTIISRLNIINVFKPAKTDLKAHYASEGYNEDDINQAILIADGLPGLADQLLSTKNSPIAEATLKAKQILTSSAYERINSINDLAKDKSELKNILFIIKQMAKIGVSSDNPKSAIRWRKILSATLDSELKLINNVQVKLLLTDYMLRIS